MLYRCLHGAYMATNFDFGRPKCWWALPTQPAWLLVPVRGVEPPTFALRMRAINLLPSLISVGIVYVNQQVKRTFCIVRPSWR